MEKRSDIAASPSDSLPPTAADRAAVVAAMVFPALLTWVYFGALAHAPAAVQQSVYGLGKTLQFAFPIAWVWAVQRQRPAWRTLRWPGTAEGLAFGVVVAAAMLAGYRWWLGPAGYFTVAQQAIAEKIRGFGIAGPAGYAGMALFYSLLHSLLEEYYWRWFVFGQLRRLMGRGAAIALASLAFTAHHVIVLGLYFGFTAPPVYLFSAGVGVGGAYWCWLLARSRSLTAVWLSHLVVDAAIFLVGYDLVRGLLG